MFGTEIDIRFVGNACVDLIVRSDNIQNVNNIILNLENCISNFDLLANHTSSITSVGDPYDRDPFYKAKSMFVGTKSFSCLKEDWGKILVEIKKSTQNIKSVKFIVGNR